VVARRRHKAPTKATPSAGLRVALPAGLADASPARSPGTESTETTHFSVVDAAGNAVGNTYTLNGGFGSGVTIPGTGILMNNEMDDFTAKPGVPNAYGLLQGEANAIAPGKRPLSSMTPTFVFQDGRLLLVTGSPGGSTIINTVLEVITNVIDHHMSVAQAVQAPRIHHQWMPDVINYEPDGLAPSTLAALRAMGHALAVRSLYEYDVKDIPLSEYYQGDAHTIAIDPKSRLLLGAADPRKPDAKAVGY
jgi:gamma-glutamyltranspeptidase/glutathione hydrolase